MGSFCQNDERMTGCGIAEGVMAQRVYALPVSLA